MDIIIILRVSSQVEAACFIIMDSAILEIDFEVVGVKLGRCIFNTILGEACSEIHKFFLLIIEEVAELVISIISRLEIRRRDCYRVCRWLGRDV